MVSGSGCRWLVHVTIASRLSNNVYQCVETSLLGSVMQFVPPETAMLSNVTSLHLTFLGEPSGWLALPPFVCGGGRNSGIVDLGYLKGELILPALLIPTRENSLFSSSIQPSPYLLFSCINRCSLALLESFAVPFKSLSSSSLWQRYRSTDDRV